MKYEIKHRFSGEVLFSLECASFKLCVEAAVKARANLTLANLTEANLTRANLTEANLTLANLTEADLTWANLTEANLTLANLTEANLTWANLTGANLTRANLTEANLTRANTDIKPASAEDAIFNLDTVRDIILGNPRTLEMQHWHSNNEWTERTCEEEKKCGTTHCLAGWLQVCSTDAEIRKLPAALAGTLLAPVATKMFYETNERCLEWLKNREYADGH